MRTTSLLKRQVTYLVIIICIFPSLLGILGVDLSSELVIAGQNQLSGSFNELRFSSGAIHHVLLEWSAIIIAGLITISSFIHYLRNKDISVPIIGLAFLFAGVVDTFHVFASMQLIDVVSDSQDFIPYTWAISRMTNASIMLVATILVFALSTQSQDVLQRYNSVSHRVLSIVALSFFLIIAYVIYTTVNQSVIPVTQFPNALFKRPYDAIPLALFFLCGMLYWLLYRQQRKVFRYALFLSAIAEVSVQLHMVFGSSVLFDHHSNIAHFVKIVAYGIILMGVLVDLVMSNHVPANTVVSANANQAAKETVSTVNGVSSRAEYDETQRLKKRNLLSYQLPMIGFLLSSGVAVVVGLVIFYESSQIIAQQRQNQLSNEAIKVEQLLQSKVRQTTEQLYSLLANDKLVKMLNNIPSDDASSTLSNLLAEQARLVKKVSSLFLLENNTNPKKITTRAVYKFGHEVVTAPTLLQWCAKEQYMNGQNNYIVRLRYLDEKLYWVIGVRVTGANKDTWLMSLQEHEDISNLINALTFNDSDIILTSTDGLVIDDTLASVQNTNKNNKGSTFLKVVYPELFAILDYYSASTLDDISITLNGESYLGFHQLAVLGQNDEDDKLHIFVVQSNETFVDSFTQVQSRILLIFISLMIVVLSISIFTSQRLTQPLTKIVSAIRRYQKSGEIGEIPVQAQGEIGVLSRSFSLMMKEISSKEKAQEQAYNEATDISAKMQSILNSMVDAVINIDEHGKIIAFNRSAEKMFGYSEHEVIGQNIQLLMPAKIADTHDSYLADYIRTGKKNLLRQGRELPALRKDGETFPMFLSLSEIDTKQGKLFTGLIRDITATKLLEAESKQMLQSAKDLAWRLDFSLSGPQIGIWDYDLVKHVLNWDKRMYRLYGTDIKTLERPEDIWRSAVHPADIDKIEASVAKIVNTGIDLKQVFRVILPNKQTSYIEAHAKALYDSEGNITRLLGTNRDITEQHHLHELKQQALDMAEDSLRLKSEFLASMSHEIRTPMNGVLGMLGLLEKSTLDERQHHYLQLASSSANSLLNLINDILDFSKIEAGKLELEVVDFDLRCQLGEVVESLALKAQEKNIEIILDVNDIEDSMIKGDPTRIRQVVSNLISNAIKFTDSGEIVIRARLTEKEQGKLQLTCAVTDSGIGISSDKVGRLFDSFTQVDASTTRKYGGTGLGLAIVKQLCQLMNGDISVVSELNKGSTFEFTVTLEKSEREVIVMPSIHIEGAEVLIVDDNETNLEVLEGQLMQWGAKITKARNGEETLKLIKQHPDNHFKVAILDMQMPSMDGAELGKLMKSSSQCAETKLIMMTSMGAAGDAKYFAELGFSAYFPKPTTTSDLFDALTVVLDNSDALRKATPLVTHEHLQTLVKQEPTTNMINDVKILLVEDNRINQAVVLGMLEHSGCKTELAFNGQEALEKLEQSEKGKPYDIVLMDCQMPVMDGYQATKAIRNGESISLLKQIPIIAMTANAMKGDKEKCLEVGMNDYIAKPVDGELLISKIKQWTNTETSSIKEEGSLASDSHSAQEATAQKDDGAVVWNSEGLLKRVRGNQILAKKLVDMFVEEAPEAFKAISKAINTKQFEEITAVAHKIKGSGRNVGGEKLGECANKLEQAAKNKDNQEIQRLYPKFEEAFFEFIEKLKNSEILL